MLTTENGLRDLWSRSQTLHMSASGIVCKGNGFLLGFDCWPSNDHGRLNLRDSVTVVGEVIALYESSGMQGISVGYPFPRPFTIGLYAEFADRMDFVVIHYILNRGMSQD